MGNSWKGFGSTVDEEEGRLTGGHTARHGPLAVCLLDRWVAQRRHPTAPIGWVIGVSRVPAQAAGTRDWVTPWRAGCDRLDRLVRRWGAMPGWAGRGCGTVGWQGRGGAGWAGVSISRGGSSVS